MTNEVVDPLDLWVEELRSGKYQQGSGFLSTGGKYCCLGVACELYREHVGPLDVGEKLVIDGGGCKKCLLFGGNMSFAPPEVVSWLKLRDEDAPYFDESGNTVTLAYQNDSGASFEDIASIIESRPDGLQVREGVWGRE